MTRHFSLVKIININMFLDIVYGLDHFKSKVEGKSKGEINRSGRGRGRWRRRRRSRRRRMTIRKGEQEIEWHMFMIIFRRR